MRSTMRFCGAFRLRQKLSCPEDGPKTHRTPGQGVRAALFAVDDTDRRLHPEAGIAQGLDRVEERAAGGDDVLDEAHELALLERAFQPVAGAVLLRLLADDEERQARFERRGGRERDRAELGRGEPNGIGRVLADDGGDALAERAQQIGPGLEAVLVEVVLRALAGAEDEVALEIGVLDERAAQLGVLHRRAAASASRAIGSTASASSEPSTYVIIVPSSK